MTAVQYMGNQQFSLADSPVIKPKSDEVRLAVGYVGICGTDMHIYHGVLDQRVGPPQIIGHEMAGVVQEVGSEVKDVKTGDRVVVRPLDYCDQCPACDAGLNHICHNLKFMGIDSAGALQENWTVKARTLHHLPDSVSLKVGAMVEPLAVACHDVQRSRLAAGEKAVVLGGGPIGQLIAQVARVKGAEVMVSEINEVRLQFARDQGIHAVNPLDVDLEDEVRVWSGGKGADVVFEVTGIAAAVEQMTKIAAARGRICMVAIHATPVPVNLYDFFFKELEMIGARVYEGDDFDLAINLLTSGAIDLEPFISSVHHLSETRTVFERMNNNPSELKALISCTT